MTALPNPFFDSALVPATGSGMATAPDLSDPPVAVAANLELVTVSSVALSGEPQRARPPFAGLSGAPVQESPLANSNSVVTNAEYPVVSLEPPPVSAGATGNNAELAGAEEERAVLVRSLGIRAQEQDPAFNPEPALPAMSIVREAETSADAVLPMASAAFSCRDIPVDMGALYRAITKSNPRDLDLDPAPLFLRKPSPAFLRSLFALAGGTR